MWAVNACTETGMVQVLALSLSGTWGFAINMKDLYATTGWDIVKKAGGEILERYRVKRGQADNDQIDSIRSVAGMKVFDTSDLANKCKAPKILDASGNPFASVAKIGV